MSCKVYSDSTFETMGIVYTFFRSKKIREEKLKL